MNATQRQERDLLSAAFLANLVGGSLILIGGVAMGAMAGMMGMMMGVEQNGGMGMMKLGLLWGLLTGGTIVFAGFRYRANPDDASAWGVATLVAALLSLLVMGGFLIGAVASGVGGTLAILDGRRSQDAARTRTA